MDEDPVEAPHDIDPEFAEVEARPVEPTDVDKGLALEAEARAKGGRS